MPEKDRGDLPGAVVAQIATLLENRERQVDLALQVLRAGGGTIYEFDLLVLAALQRSVCLIDGFVTLVRARNLFAAVPLIRLQLDSLMRLHACDIAEDPHEIAMALFDDMPISRLKAKSGRQLTDKFLRTELDAIFEGVSQLYERTSGFVHLSPAHLIFPIQSIENDQRVVNMLIRARGDEWQDDDLASAVGAFTHATRVLFEECVNWRNHKERLPPTESKSS